MEYFDCYASVQQGDWIHIIMQVAKQDADLYFKLMWSLQSYVNRKLNILPDVVTVDDYQSLPASEKLAVREALYENPNVIDAYLNENPQNFSAEELEIVQSWKNFERGDFFIERLLKKYAIFIKEDAVYGVLALHDPFSEMLPKQILPYYAKAVLLPFKGRIIYDSLLQGYSVFFGSGIKSDLKETYLTAKQNGRIIESLDVHHKADQPSMAKKPQKDWGPTVDTLLQQVKKLRSEREAPAIQSPAFSLARASLELTQLAVEQPDELDELWKAWKKVERALRKAETVLHRAEPY